MATNYSCVIALVNEAVRAINVRFNENGQTYTYKTFDETIEVGDWCLVPDATDHDRYKAVEVVGVDGEFNFDSSTQYKWIVCRCDTHNDLLLRSLLTEGQVVSKIKAGERKARRETILKQQLNLQEEELQSIADLSNLIAIEDYETEARKEEAKDNGETSSTED